MIFVLGLNQRPARFPLSSARAVLEILFAVPDCVVRVRCTPNCTYPLSGKAIVLLHSPKSSVLPKTYEKNMLFVTHKQYR